jgi:LPS-assembly protein
LTRQPNADRGLLRAQLARPFTRPWGFFTPKVQLHATTYRFDRDLDGGLVFERDARYFGRAFRQTLEPRLMYVYTPYRSQNHLPNYDTGLYDFNFATIWAENSFVGADRVMDNNLITGGLTTRLLDPESGAEMVRLAVAQRYRFSGQRVILPGGAPTSPGWSDIMLGASINWDPRWAFDTVVQYNPDTRRSMRTTIHARYSPGPYRTVGVAYRNQRDLKNESIDLGWQWPLGDLMGGHKEPSAKRQGGGSCSGAWYSMGRLNYSLSDRKIVDAVIGLEYDAGCWIGRIALEQLHSSITSAATRRIMFQLEFVGLSRLGSSLMTTLRNNIPRYQNLREPVPPPSRFSAYD